MINEELNADCRVFISCHGGGMHGMHEKSAYPMGMKLYEYFTERGISCFICKESKEAGFTEAINRALQSCNHFILVAQDKELLYGSEWVKGEVNEFDALRKNGLKKNCVMSALIYGNLTDYDLFRYNALFATVDIVKGEAGIPRLYDYISEAERIIHSGSGDEAARLKNGEMLSFDFIDGDLYGYADYTEEDFRSHDRLLTKRVKNMDCDFLPDGCDSVMDYFLNRILAGYEEKRRQQRFSRDRAQKDKNLLRLSGEPGTQKSYILQLLYIYLLRNPDKHPFDPVYINLQTMERDIYQQGVSVDSYASRVFEGLEFKTGRVPLFIVDGVLGVVVNCIGLDNAIKKKIDAFPDAEMIMGFNPVLSDNKARLNRSRLAHSKFEINIQLRPTNLYDREKSIEYISTVRELSMEPEELYSVLNKCGLLTINESVIRAVADECEFEDTTSVNITDLFEAKILDFLDGDTWELIKGAKIVFDFIYDTVEIDMTSPLAVKMLKIISESATYMDCLTAIYYCHCLEQYDKTGDISTFKMIFPKTVTRFIVKRVNVSAKCEKNLVELGKRYNELPPDGQSEMSFFLGRIKSPAYREDAVALLKKYYLEQQEKIRQKRINAQYFGEAYTRENSKEDLFLLRGLSVSLIYCGSRGALSDYLNSLLSDDLANSINRGFHLEYYGDKKYLPNHSHLDYEDDARSGERTLRILCNSCEGQLRSGKLLPSFVLELFTICSLLQARIEVSREVISFNTLPYIEKCLRLISDYKKLGSEFEASLSEYFDMVSRDFAKYTDAGTVKYNPKRDLCNELLRAADIKRAGWVNQGIEAPESITDHMYSCFFIGMVFLPVEYSAEGYDKQKILNMLLIHDIGETILGDIPKYDKPADFDAIENATMLRLLLKGTYAGMPSVPEYVEAWNSWYKRENENAVIAKDIDTIQAIYQFLIYNLKFPEKFSDERRVNWLREIHQVTSELGRGILAELVLENPLFKETLDEYRGKY